MTSKVTFLYLHGTDPLIGQVAEMIGQRLGVTPFPPLLTVPGINGTTATWNGSGPRNDPFCNLLDPNIFTAIKVGYPALIFPTALSVNAGITNVINAINALPKGSKFMLGGYSQGAVCQSSVYNEIRSGSLVSRSSDFLGGVMFGNPRRQVNYRGPVGGTWSGAWDIPGSTTGGHGSFPTTGPFPRLSGCDERWVEFTAEDDIFSSTGDSVRGQNWVNGNNALLTMDLIGIISAILPWRPDIEAAFALGNAVNTFVDATGKVFDVGGNGHTDYPWVPPFGNPDNGLTHYQIAVKWLTQKANEYATSPILLPPTPSTTSNAGWTTNLIPPAA